MHVHRERERPLHLHRVQQPAELGRVGQRGDVERLLEVAVHAQVALIGAVDRRAGDELAQRQRGSCRLTRVRDGVERPEDLEPGFARAGAALGRAVRRGRVEAPPQQVEDFRAGEHVGGEVERLEVAADPVGQVQRLARHPAVRLKRPLQRGARQPAPARREQLAPVQA